MSNGTWWRTDDTSAHKLSLSNFRKIHILQKVTCLFWVLSLKYNSYAVLHWCQMHNRAAWHTRTRPDAHHCSAPSLGRQAEPSQRSLAVLLRSTCVLCVALTRWVNIQKKQDIQWGRHNFFSKWCCETWTVHAKEWTYITVLYHSKNKFKLD